MFAGKMGGVVVLSPGNAVISRGPSRESLRVDCVEAGRIGERRVSVAWGKPWCFVRDRGSTQSGSGRPPSRLLQKP